MIIKTVYNHNLRKPDSYTVEYGGHKATFKRGEEAMIGDWIQDIWTAEEDGIFNVHSPAYVYYNIDWDCDHVLYAKYEKEG